MLSKYSYPHYPYVIYALSTLSKCGLNIIHIRITHVTQMSCDIIHVIQMQLSTLSIWDLYNIHMRFIQMQLSLLSKCDLFIIHFIQMWFLHLRIIHFIQMWFNIIHAIQMSCDIIHLNQIQLSTLSILDLYIIHMRFIQMQLSMLSKCDLFIIHVIQMWVKHYPRYPNVISALSKCSLRLSTLSKCDFCIIQMSFNIIHIIQMPCDIEMWFLYYANLLKNFSYILDVIHCGIHCLNRITSQSKWTMKMFA